MRELFCDMGNDAVLLVDVNNAIHCQTALHNIRVLCPTLSTILINTYRAPVHLFIAGGKHMLSGALRPAGYQCNTWQCQCRCNHCWLEKGSYQSETELRYLWKERLKSEARSELEM